MAKTARSQRSSAGVEKDSGFGLGPSLFGFRFKLVRGVGFRVEG